LDLVLQGKSSDEIRKLTGSVVAVRDVSLHVQKNEISVVMGLSGSGKSTLLRCINRLVIPTAGKVYLELEREGRLEISSLNKKKLLDIRRNHMAMVFQNFALFPRKTVLANVCFGLSLQHKDNTLGKAMEALQLVGLKEWVNAYPSQLSGGMQQRVGLARALATDVKVLLMDEAFSALDPLIRHDLQGELLNLQFKLKKTILFVTHDLSEALRLGDIIVIMQDGEFVQKGTPEDIILNPRTEYVKTFVKNADPSEVIKAETISTKPEELVTDSDNHLCLFEYPNNYVFQLTSDNKLKDVFLNKETRLIISEFHDELEHSTENEGERICILSCTVSLKKVMEAMVCSIHPFVILSKDGKFCGVVKRRNIFKALLKKFEK
jgi:glycine betaine/proline transport system ATP-binding protein